MAPGCGHGLPAASRSPGLSISRPLDLRARPAVARPRNRLVPRSLYPCNRRRATCPQRSPVPRSACPRGPLSRGPPVPEARPARRTGTLPASRPSRPPFRPAIAGLPWEKTTITDSRNPSTTPAPQAHRHLPYRHPSPPKRLPRKRPSPPAPGPQTSSPARTRPHGPSHSRQSSRKGRTFAASREASSGSAGTPMATEPNRSKSSRNETSAAAIIRAESPESENTYRIEPDRRGQKHPPGPGRKHLAPHLLQGGTR